MGVARLAGRHRSRAGPPSWPREEEKADIDKLREENAQLRELVIQLTKLAIKNIVDPPSAPRPKAHSVNAHCTPNKRRAGTPPMQHGRGTDGGYTKGDETIDVHGL
jgi:hypothetical protein